MKWKEDRKKMKEFVNVSLGVPHPRIQECSINAIKERYFRGEYSGENGNAIIQLLQEVEELTNFKAKALDVAAKGDMKLDLLTAELADIRKAFPGPECECCSCEMEIDVDEAWYSCTECYPQGCSCSAMTVQPCGYCEQVRPAWDHMMSGDARIRMRAVDNQRRHEELVVSENVKSVARGMRELGPSAVAKAKPVTKLVIGCQGDYWDGAENL